MGSYVRQLSAALMAVLIAVSASWIRPAIATTTSCVPAWNLFAGTDHLSSTIHTSVRGQDNLIYIGGRDGLYRVGGGNVNSWFPDFTDLSALPSGHIKALAVDNEFIWVGSNSGIARLNTRTGVIERSPQVNQQSQYASVNALAVHQDHVFVGTDKGGYVIARNNDINDIQIIQTFESVGTIRDIQAVNQQLFSAGKNGLWSLTATAPPEQVGLDDFDLVDMERINDELWVLAIDSLHRVEINTSSTGDTELAQWSSYTRETLAGLPESSFRKLTSDHLDRLWIGAASGLSRWDLSQTQPRQCRLNMTGSDRFEDIDIAHLSGHLGDYVLLGSRGRGATSSPISPAIRRVVPGSKPAAGLNGNKIWSHVLNAKGQLIAGTSKGLFIESNPGSGQFKPIAPDQVGDKRIYSLGYIDNNRLAVGSSKGLYVSDKGSVAAIDLLVDADGKRITPSVFAIKRWRNKLLLGTSHGLIVVNPSNFFVDALFATRDDIQLANSMAGPIFPIPISRVWSIDVRNEVAFIAGQDGALSINLVNNQIIASTKSSQKEVSQPIGYLYTVVAVDEKRLFLGTEAGLLESDHQFSTFKKITEINHRQLVSVMSSGRDQQGNTWIGVAYNGLFRYQPQTDTWFHLTQSKGLVTNGISQLGMSFSGATMMTVSNGTGASVVDLSRLDAAGVMPIGLKIVDTANRRVLGHGEQYILPSAQRDIALHFIATEIIEPDLYKVVYSLTPESGTPRNMVTDFDQTLSLINLTPGVYQFQAVAVDTSGRESAPVRFSIDVEPHWWETRALKIAIVLFMVALICSYFYFQRRRVELRMDIIADERKRIAQELHDTSLQDIFGAKMLARSLLDCSADSQYQDTTRRFLGLIDTAIGSLRQNVNSLSNFTNVPPLPTAVAQIEKAIKVCSDTQLDISSEGKPWALGMQRRFFVYRMIREAAMNAVKHANAQCIHIHLEWSALSLNVVVKDNGDGFDIDAVDHAATYGLTSLRNMSRAARVDLSITSALKQGTRVQIKIPRLII